MKINLIEKIAQQTKPKIIQNLLKIIKTNNGISHCIKPSNINLENYDNSQIRHTVRN